MTPAWLAEAQELRAQQWSYARIGKAVGASRSQVYYWLERVSGKRARSGMKKCKGCGAEFNHYDLRQKYCSRDCYLSTATPPGASEETRRRWQKERRGEGNPNYRHGKSRSGPRRFSLKAKGEHRCRNCRSTHNLHLHHAIPKSMFRAGRFEVLNGLPLCSRCHLGWHRREVVLHRDLFTEDEWAYLTSAELLGQSTMAWLDDRYPPRDELPAAVEEYAREHGLVWSLERDYGVPGIRPKGGWEGER